MKKIVLLIVLALNFYASERQPLLTDTQINDFTTHHLSIKKAGFTDAKHFVALVADHRVSRFMFCAEASESDIKNMTGSWFTKIVAPIAFLLPAKWISYRWMIRKTGDNKDSNQEEVIGSLSLMNLNDKNILDAIKTVDQEKYKDYMNLGVSLKPTEWGKGYADESVFALLSKLFVAQEFQQVAGVALLVNKDNERCLNWVMKKNKPNKRLPLTYHPDVYLPNGFKIIHKPCTAKLFTVKKEDFLNLLSSTRNNTN